MAIAIPDLRSHYESRGDAKETAPPGTGSGARLPSNGRRQIMNKVTLTDIVGNAAYEKMRDKLRQRIIELKRHRRVSVGDKVTLVFENRDTVIFQIQEMMRAEKISDLDKIREEIEVYNELIPAPGELSATLFLEIEDQTHLREDLLKFLGIDESVYFKVGNHPSMRALKRDTARKTKSARCNT